MIQYFETMIIALNSLRANKLRSFLTILGIVVGIFSIISISTVVSMLQVTIDSGLSILGKNTFQIQKFPAIRMGHVSDKIRNRKDITFEEYEKLKERLTSAKYVGAEQWNFGKIIKFGKEETNPNIQIAGVSVDAFPTNEWVIEDGRAINQGDVDRYARVCVLGAEVASRLFKYVDPIEQEIRVDGFPMRVIGVIETQGAMFGQSRDNFVVIPITTFQNFYGKRSRSVNITVMAHDSDSYDELIESSIGHMRAIRKVAPGDENDFEIFSNESLITQVNDITKYVKLGSIFVGMIALLAAGVGIMNIMLVSVTERTREIGIRKAIGANKKSVLIQFLIEAIILCQFGGLIGIILGIGVGNLAGAALNAKATIPVDWVVIGVMICVGVGVFFGAYPAYKAANLDPIEALRYE